MTEPTAQTGREAETPVRARAGFWYGLIAVVGVGVFYVLMPVANFTDAKDALRYAARIGEGAPYFHPNHLLYEPVIYVLHRLTQALAGPVDPLSVMQWVSILCALPFLLCTYLLTWRANHSAVLAVLATGAVGFCFGVWVYAVSPDGYLPPLFLAVLTLVLLDPQRWQHRHKTLPQRLLIGAALATAAAVLLHQMYVIFALVAGFVMLFRAEFGGLQARARAFLIYGGVSGGVVALVYLVVYFLVAPADLGFLDWARGFAREGLYYGDPPSLLSPVKGAIGALSTMLTINGLLSFDAIAARMIVAFPGKSLHEEQFIAQTAILPWLRLPILLAMLGATLLWLAMARASISERWQRRRAPGYVDTVLLTAVILYAVAVIVWEPTNREFWIQTYVFATIWCLRQIPALTRARGMILGGLVGCLFTVNFFAGLLPLSDPRSDYWRVYNAQVIARRGEVDLVVTSCSWLCMWYIQYFAGARALSPAAVDPETLEAMIAQAGADRVLISSLAYAPHRLAFVHAPARFRAEWTEAFRTAYPAPVTLPEGDAQQVFFGLEKGAVVPLPPR